MSHNDLMNQEFQLILRCARSRPDAPSVRDLVSKNIDWRVLLELAAHHCIRPLLLRSLKSVCWDAVPQTIQRELTLLNEVNIHKNLAFTGELLRLLNVFQQNAIRVAAFKGPVLAHALYGDISLREFSDLDVIIHEADLSKAEDILTACGYQADFPDRDYRSAFLSYQGQYAFRHGNTGLSVDLHWQLSGRSAAFPRELAEMWPRLEQVTMAGRPVLTFGHDDLVLFLAAHGTKEGWRSLIWVCDFAELIGKYQDIEWKAVLDRAQRCHALRPLLLAIALASSLLDAPAPAALVDRAWNNSVVRALAEQAKQRMLSPAPEGELQQFLTSLNMHDHLRHKLWPVVTLLTTRTVGDYRALPLPKSLWGLYYLTRPFRLAGKLLKMMRAVVFTPLPTQGSSRAALQLN